MHDCFAIELTGECLKCFIRLTRGVPAVVVQSEALLARIPEIQVRIPSRAMGTFFPHTVSSIFRLSLTHIHTNTRTHVHTYTHTHTKRTHTHISTHITYTRATAGTHTHTHTLIRKLYIPRSNQRVDRRGGNLRPVAYRKMNLGYHHSPVKHGRLRPRTQSGWTVYRSVKKRIMMLNQGRDFSTHN